MGYAKKPTHRGIKGTKEIEVTLYGGAGDGVRIEERGCKSRRGGGKKGKMKWKEGRGKTEKGVERRKKIRGRGGRKEVKEKVMRRGAGEEVDLSGVY